MKFHVTSKNAVFIELNGWTYYIDDSTDEQFVDKWVTGDAPTERDLAEWNSDPKV